MGDRDEEFRRLWESLPDDCKEKDRLLKEKDRLQKEKDLLLKDTDRLRKEQDRLLKEQEEFQRRERIRLVEEGDNTLPVYLRQLEEIIRAGIPIKTDTALPLNQCATKVEGKYCPEYLRWWDEFPAIHRERYERIAGALGDQKITYSSKTSIRNNLDHYRNAFFKSDFASQSEVVLLVNAYVEYPASQIANHYFQHLSTQPPNYTVLLSESAKFSNFQYGQDAEEADTNIRSTVLSPREDPSPVGPGVANLALENAPREADSVPVVATTVSATVATAATTTVSGTVPTPAITTTTTTTATASTSTPAAAETPGPSPSMSCSHQNSLPDRWFDLEVETVNADGEPSGVMKRSTIVLGQFKVPGLLRSDKCEAYLVPQEPQDISQNYDNEAHHRQRSYRTVLGSVQAGPTSDAESGSKPPRYLAQALCQAYHYMMLSRVSYGYLSSGFVTILLYVDPNHPKTLRYYVVDGYNRDYQHFSQDSYTPDQTPGAQLATLVTLAVESYFHNMNSGRYSDGHPPSATRSGLGQWQNPTSHKRPRDEGRSTNADTPDAQPASNRPRLSDTSPTDAAEDTLIKMEADERPVDVAEADGIISMSPYFAIEVEGGMRLMKPKYLYGDEAIRESQRRTKEYLATTAYPKIPPTNEYCTQACLRGLATKGPLDSSCPNYLQHFWESDGTTTCHQVSTEELLVCLRNQLDRNVFENVEFLPNHSGRAGQLFRVQVTGYGYTFVAKGVAEELQAILLWEWAIYRHCRALQGDMIPVCLGVMKITGDYWVPDREDCVLSFRYFLLMAYGGKMVHETSLPEGVRMYDEMVRIDECVYGEYHVDHRDLRRSNFVWCEETGKMMMIDFHMAKLEKKPNFRYLITEEYEGWDDYRYPQTCFGSGIRLPPPPSPPSTTVSCQQPSLAETIPTMKQDDDDGEEVIRQNRDEGTGRKRKREDE